jgi:hypothetical protein
MKKKARVKRRVPLVVPEYATRAELSQLRQDLMRTAQKGEEIRQAVADAMRAQDVLAVLNQKVRAMLCERYPARVQLKWLPASGAQETASSPGGTATWVQL